MSFEKYIEKGGQKLRMGYTTGSCAAAASKAAAIMLLTGETVSQVRLKTPKGYELILEIEDIRMICAPDISGDADTEKTCISDFAWIAEVEKTRYSVPLGTAEKEKACTPEFFKIGEPGSTGNPEKTGHLCAVSCAVRKDSGDDPDITNHALIYARVECSEKPGIRIEGGEGVGRVTKPGLDQPVGFAAINSTPRRMIEAAVREAVLEYGDCGGKNIPTGFDVTISVPQGRELAEKTFNPKLGIEGGISILGTSGIVEPMSDQALLDTIKVEIRVRREEGREILAAAPGNYGKNFFLEKYGFSLDTAVTASNFIYDTVCMAAEAGFRRMLFVGHIGKLVKVAGGIRNTHSKYGDHRMEILSEIAESILFRNMQEQQRTGDTQDLQRTGNTQEQQGIGNAQKQQRTGNAQEQQRTGDARTADEIRDDLDCALRKCVATDEAIRILKEYEIDRPVLSEMTRRIQSVMQGWTKGRMQVEVIVFSNVFGELGRTPCALEMITELKNC